jgi:MFS family permease
METVAPPTLLSAMSCINIFDDISGCYCGYHIHRRKSFTVGSEGLNTDSFKQISSDLHATATQGFWVGTAYLLSSASPMPFIAALSDIFGRPILLMLSLIFFLIGSILGSVAKNIKTLLIGRVIQGVGGGGVIILSLVITTDMVPLRYRPKYFGIM